MASRFHKTSVRQFAKKRLNFADGNADFC